MYFQVCWHQVWTMSNYYITLPFYLLLPPSVNLFQHLVVTILFSDLLIYFIFNFLSFHMCERLCCSCVSVSGLFHLTQCPPVRSIFAANNIFLLAEWLDNLGLESITTITGIEVSLLYTGILLNAYLWEFDYMVVVCLGNLHTLHSDMLRFTDDTLNSFPRSITSLGSTDWPAEWS